MVQVVGCGAGAFDLFGLWSIALLHCLTHTFRELHIYILHNLFGWTKVH